MRKLLCIYLSIILILFCACKKVTKQVNSEKIFSLIFVDSLNIPFNQCFDRVWAEGKSNLPNCSNFNVGLQLPLSIKSDSTSIFYFKTNNKTDTLILIYNRTIVPSTNEFEVLYDLTTIKGSFKKTSIKCIPNLTPSCNGDKAILSAVIFE
jgi:hypothetical protein